MPEVSETLTALQKIVAVQAAPVVRFNTELVRSAWSAVRRRRREARVAAQRAQVDFGETKTDIEEGDDFSGGWIDQLWTDHLIIKADSVVDTFLRVPYTVKDPAVSPEDVSFGTPERVRVAYVAASALSRVSDAGALLGLAKRVQTQAGERKYRKPIGTVLGVSGPVASATSGDAVNHADSLRKNIKDLASRDKTYRGGKVFGDISNEGKLKSALSAVEKLPAGKRGEAAAEVVLAAQALGLTRLVPVQVKRLYRSYLAQDSLRKN